ncbi:MAG: hypothetical protein KTR24_01290 [Saprospiraceae bacterium]|nr:hypothetical protein [Saprospiraceae bacterium]
MKATCILILTTGLKGRLHSTLALADRLRQAAHRVVFASPWDCADLVRDHQFEYLQLQATTRDTESCASPKEALEALGANHLVEVVQELAPDMLLIDFELAPHIIIAQTLDLPIALISSWFDGSRSPGLPPLSASTIPGLGWKGSGLGIAVSWWFFTARRWWHFYSKRLRWQGKDYRSVLSKLAHQWGVEMEGRTRTYDTFAVPYLWTDLPLWSMNALENDFVHTTPPNFTYIGPMVLESRQLSDARHPHYHVVKAFIEKVEQRGGNLIYVSGSTMDKSAELPALIRQIDENDHSFYFIVGGNDRVLESDHALFVETAPQLFILQHSDLVVHHGGINTINECLHYRVPMVIISGGKYDQPGCAARMDHHGLASVCYSPPNASELMALITEIITGGAMARHMETHQKAVRYYATDEILEGAVQALLAEKK